MSKRPSSASNATNKRPLRRLTRSATTDHLSCSDCGCCIALEADHAELQPCGCAFCLECLLKLLGPRSKNVQCCCGSLVCSHQYYKQRTPRQDKVLYANPGARQQTIDDRAWMNRPLASLFDVNKELFEAPPRGPCEVVLLYGLRFIKEESHERFDSMEKCIVSYNTQDSQDTIRRRMMEFGAFLHQPITARSMTPYSKMESLSPTEYLVKKVSNPTVLLAFLFGLATRKQEIDKLTVIQPIKDSLDQTRSQRDAAMKIQSQFFAVAASTDIALRSISHTPCEFQLMLGRQLGMEKISQSLRVLLSVTRIATSHACEETRLCDAVVKKMSTETLIDPRGFHLVITVNIQWMDKAGADPKKLGIKQYTKIIDIWVTFEQMVDAGIVAPDGTVLLSTQPSNTWESLSEEDDAAVRLTAVTQHDIDAHTECCAESMLQAINDALQNKFTPGSIRLRSARFHSRQARGELLMRDPNLVSMNSDDVEAMLEADVPSESDSPSQTNMVVNIVPKDLAKSSTIRLLAQYVMAVREKSLAWYNRQIADGKIEAASSPPLMSSVGSAIIADGQPSTQFLRLKAEDAISGACAYKMLNCFMGGFHCLMKLHCAIGKLFDSIFTQLYRKYRPSDARVTWIQFPGDPRQLEQEYPEFLQAVYGSAAVYFFKKYKRVPSVTELHQYMLERAEKYPVVALVILYTRYAEVAKMMKMSERKLPRGNRELFFTTLRFALPLFAMTHKKDYVRLISDFFVSWECASPALREIYDCFLMTQLGPSGHPMMSDLLIENDNRKTRQYCGKVATKDLDSRIEKSLTVSAGQKVEEGNIMKRLRTGGDATKVNRSKTHIITTPMSPIIILSDWIHNQFQLFHHEEPPIMGYASSDDSPVYLEEGSNMMLDGDCLNQEVLYVCTAGAERAKEYVQLYHLTNKHTP